MSSKRLFPVLSLLFLVAAPVAALGAGSSPGTVSITAHVDEYFTWPTMTIVAADFGGNFNQASQTKTATLNIPADTNVTAGITVKASDGGDGKGAVLKEVGGKILTTSYGLSGDITGGGDVGPTVPAATFINGVTSYPLTAGAGTKNLVLKVQAITDASGLNTPAGDYTCTVTLTASW